MKGVLLTEQSKNPPELREQMVTVMFEKLGVMSLYLASSPLMTLYALGRTTGLVVSSGEGITTTLPVLDGF